MKTKEKYDLSNDWFKLANKIASHKDCNTPKYYLEETTAEATFFQFVYGDQAIKQMLKVIAIIKYEGTKDREGFKRAIKMIEEKDL